VSNGALSNGPLSNGASSNNRHIPARVKRAVWLRDGGRCAFVGTTGGVTARRCTARALLEFHHLRPFAVGGAGSSDNIQLRCRAHNAYESDLFYGCHEAYRHELPESAAPAELVPERVGPA
jgi:5-methylcytosine-specific restriction endonuclease McrA